jgi:hypothetical protein
MLSITRNKTPVKHTYTLHGHQLEHADKAKYLGVTIQSDLKWDSHLWLVYGSHTEWAYSSDGRTKDLYACSLTLLELMFMFLRRNPSVLFAFVVMLFIWLSHLRSDCIVTPRYLLCLHVQVGVHEGCMCVLLVFYFV